MLLRRPPPRTRCRAAKEPLRAPPALLVLPAPASALSLALSLALFLALALALQRSLPRHTGAVQATKKPAPKAFAYHSAAPSAAPPRVPRLAAQGGMVPTPRQATRAARCIVRHSYVMLRTTPMPTPNLT